MARITRRAYADMYGPTTGDRVRLADTELWIEIERDLTVYGDEVKFGGGKVIRDGQGQSQRAQAEGAVDTVITNVVVLDHWGIIKADVAIKNGRIAHEIKNPLTPIQLSAERLKRRFTKEISSDPETFATLVDTIVRHVGDIGRMVDEFSSFARMPLPVMQSEDLGRIIRESLILQRNAHPEIDHVTTLPDRGPTARCDRRLIGQALVNLLQNAADAIAMRPGTGGRITITLSTSSGACIIEVADDGLGLPSQDRDRLTEPYVTHKPKGTGLGLAIVKKIMEDHGGRLGLADRTPTPDWPGTGAIASLVLPPVDAA